MINCKYRDCQLDAAHNGFCTPSHKTMYYRDRAKDTVTHGQSHGVTQPGNSVVVTGPTLHDINANTRGVNHVNTGPYKPTNELGQREVNRVSLPGDADYNGCMVEHNGQWVLRSSLL